MNTVLKSSSGTAQVSAVNNTNYTLQLNGVANSSGTTSTVQMTIAPNATETFYALPGMTITADNQTFSVFDAPPTPADVATGDIPVYQLFQAFGAMPTSDLSSVTCANGQPHLAGMLTADGTQELNWLATCNYPSTLASIKITGITSVTPPPAVKPYHGYNPWQLRFLIIFFVIIAIILILVIWHWIYKSKQRRLQMQME